jgi:hypothetical protein
MITQTKEELDAAFKSAVDSYFQLQRDYAFLKAQRDRLQRENDDLKKLIGVYP